uniref:Uncharacterized protein n=1 Tax=Anopheles coluzzii TaxID=1518534 RepID=A0A8W7NYX7_ANOCL
MFCTPFLSVTIELGQDEQEPCIFSFTTPSSKPMKMMSPPSSCTVGRMRVSSSSLIICTVSSSSSLNCVSGFGFASVTTGKPDAKKSIITANTSGLMMRHSASSCFEMVTKSPPKNTARTPSTRNSSLASGLHWAADTEGKSIVWPFSSTGTPGRNFRLSGFGVSCVWMNMLRRLAASVAGQASSCLLPPGCLASVPGRKALLVLVQEGAKRQQTGPQHRLADRRVAHERPVQCAGRNGFDEAHGVKERVPQPGSAFLQRDERVHRTGGGGVERKHARDGGDREHARHRHGELPRDVHDRARPGDVPLVEPGKPDAPVVGRHAPGDAAHGAHDREHLQDGDRPGRQDDRQLQYLLQRYLQQALEDAEQRHVAVLLHQQLVRSLLGGPVLPVLGTVARVREAQGVPVAAAERHHHDTEQRAAAGLPVPPVSARVVQVHQQVEQRGDDAGHEQPDQCQGEVDRAPVPYSQDSSTVRLMLTSRNRIEMAVSSMSHRLTSTLGSSVRVR